MSERRFLVFSEAYPSGGGEFEPPEYGSDVWEGAAKNRADARRKAYFAWRDRKDNNGDYIDWNRSDGKHPLAGVTVIEYAPCPEHGFGEECSAFVREERGGTLLVPDHNMLAVDLEPSAQQAEPKDKG